MDAHKSRLKSRLCLLLWNAVGIPQMVKVAFPSVSAFIIARSAHPFIQGQDCIDHYDQYKQTHKYIDVLDVCTVFALELCSSPFSDRVLRCSGD